MIVKLPPSKGMAPAPPYPARLRPVARAVPAGAGSIFGAAGSTAPGRHDQAQRKERAQQQNDQNVSFRYPPIDVPR